MPDYNLYENVPRGDTWFPVELQRNIVPFETLTCPPHWHEQIELYFILQGELNISCDQNEYCLKPGDFLAVNSYEVHTAFCPRATLESLIMVFDINEFIDDFSKHYCIFKPLIHHDQTIRRLFLSIFEEYEKQDIGYHVAMKGKLYELLTYLMRNFMIKNPEGINIAQKKKNLDRLNPVLHYIEKNYMNPSVTIDDMAKLANLSVGRFAHLFKDITGISPGTYLNNHRLEKAYSLLLDGQMNSSEAALTVGFSDYNNFSNQFKRLYHVTPSKIYNKTANPTKHKQLDKC